MFGLLPLLFLPLSAETITLERSVDDYWAVEDTTLNSRNASEPGGGDSVLLGGPGRTILIQFHDLERRLRGKKIVSAKLELTITGGTPKILAARKLTKGWSEGPMRVVAKGDPTARWAATWSSRRTGLERVPWQLEGARGSEDATRISGVTEEISSDTYTLSGLGAAFEEMRKRPYANHGIALEFSESCEFLSSEATEGRPRLILDVEPLQKEKNAPDLAVQLISRSPEYPRIQVGLTELDGFKIPDAPTNPTAKMWPDDNENVTYTAVVVNRGTVASQPFEAIWGIRDRQFRVVSVNEPLQPGESKELKLDLPFKLDIFDHRRQPISLQLIPKGQDSEPSNDGLEIQENGLALGIVLPKNFNLEEAPEDWVQGVVRTWNEVYARHSKYSFAPDGCKERIFVQRFYKENPPAAEALNLDAVIKVEDAWFVKGRDFAEQELLVAICKGLGLVDLRLPAEFPEAADAFGGLLGGDTRSDAPFPPSLAIPYDPAFDAVASRLTLLPRKLLSAVDVGALNGRVGRRRGYSGEYLFDVPERLAVLMSDINGKPLSNAEFTFVPLIDGQLAFAKQMVIKSTEQGGLILNPKELAEQKPTLNGSVLASNPFGVIDVTYRNPAYRVQVTHNGVTSTAWLKVWQAVQGIYRGQRQIGFLTLRFNVPEFPVMTENLVQPNSSAFTDGNDSNETTVEGTLQIPLQRDTAVGEIRIKASSLPERFVIEAEVAGTQQPVQYYIESSGSWALKGRAEDGWVVYRKSQTRVKSLRIRSVSGEPFKVSEVKVFGSRL